MSYCQGGMSFLDPFLTGDVIRDPIKASDGHIYDRRALAIYFNSMTSSNLPVLSPVTRQPMSMELFEVDVDGFPKADDNLTYTDNLKSVVDLGKYFSYLDPCRNLLDKALDGWTPPCVIVVGSENSGKSSVFERLTLMSIFPRREGFCTRIPIQARLRRTCEAEPPILVVMENATKREILRKVIPIHNGHMEVEQAMHQILLDTVGSITGICTTHSIVLHIHSPRVPSIDLIDLPGIVAGAVIGEPSDLSQVTRNLLDWYITTYGDRAIYLAVCPATIATNKDIAFGFLQERGLESKTIGVITMCDLRVTTSSTIANTTNSNSMLRVDSHGLRELIGGTVGFGGKSAIQLQPHGYVCVMNAPFVASGSIDNGTAIATYYQQMNREIDFFTINGLSDLLESNRASGNALTTRLNQLYSSYLIETWLPKTIVLLSSKLTHLQHPIKSIGLPDYSDLTQFESNKRSDFISKCLQCINDNFVQKRFDKMGIYLAELVDYFTTSNSITNNNNSNNSSNDNRDKFAVLQYVPTILLCRQEMSTGTTIVDCNACLVFPSIALADIDQVVKGVVDHVSSRVATYQQQILTLWGIQTPSEEKWLSFADEMRADISSFKFGRFEALIQNIAQEFYPQLKSILTEGINNVNQHLQSIQSVSSSISTSKYVSLSKGDTFPKTMRIRIAIEELICDCVHLLITRSLHEIHQLQLRVLETVVVAIPIREHIESQETLQLRQKYNSEVQLLEGIRMQLLLIIDEANALSPMGTTESNTAIGEEYSELGSNEDLCDDKDRRSGSSTSSSSSLSFAMQSASLSRQGSLVSSSPVPAITDTPTTTISSPPSNTVTIAPSSSPLRPITTTEKLIEQCMESLHQQAISAFQQALTNLRSRSPLTRAQINALIERALLLKEGKVSDEEFHILRKMELSRDNTANGITTISPATEITSSDRKIFRSYHQDQLEIILKTAALEGKSRPTSASIASSSSSTPSNLLLTLRRCAPYRKLTTIQQIINERNFSIVFEAHFGVFVKSASGKSWQGSADIINESCLGKWLTTAEHNALHELYTSYRTQQYQLHHQSQQQQQPQLPFSEKTANVLLNLFENYRPVLTNDIGIYGKVKAIAERYGSIATASIGIEEQFVPHVVGAWSRLFNMDEKDALRMMHICGSFELALKLNRAREYLHISDLGQCEFLRDRWEALQDRSSQISTRPSSSNSNLRNSVAAIESSSDANGPIAFNYSLIDMQAPTDTATTSTIAVAPANDGSYATEVMQSPNDEDSFLDDQISPMSAGRTISSVSTMRNSIVGSSAIIETKRVSFSQQFPVSMKKVTSRGSLLQSDVNC